MRPHGLATMRSTPSSPTWGLGFETYVSSLVKTSITPPQRYTVQRLAVCAGYPRTRPPRQRCPSAARSHRRVAQEASLEPRDSAPPTSGALPYVRGSASPTSSGFSALARRYASTSTWGARYDDVHRCQRGTQPHNHARRRTQTHADTRMYHDVEAYAHLLPACPAQRASRRRQAWARRRQVCAHRHLLDALLIGVVQRLGVERVPPKWRLLLLL